MNLRNGHIVLVAAMMLAATAASYAQQQADAPAQQPYALQVGGTNKVLNVDQFGVAPSTTVYELMKMLPEVLNRQSGTLLSNYSVKVNDVTVGDMNDAFLTQLRVADVEKIEIEESTTSSFSNNGEGGSINIVLKDAKEEGKLSGNVNFDGSYQPDFVPGFLLSYKKDKWKVTSILKADYYDPKSSIVTVDNDFGPSETYTTDSRYIGETGHIVAVRTGSMSKLTMSLAECTSLTKTDEKGSDRRARTYKIVGHAKYELNFRTGGKISTEGEYSFNPTNNILDGDDSKRAQHQAVAQVEYERPLYRKGSNNVIFNLGANSSYTHAMPMACINPDNNIERSTFAMPYVKLGSHIGQWDLHAELNCQYFGYDLGHDGSYSIKGDHFDLIGLVSAGWQFTDHQMLRLIADRKIERQNSLTLDPVKVAGLNLDYVIDGASGPHSWIVNVSSGYIHANDIFATPARDYDTDDILEFDVMTRYNVGIFSLSLDGNVYHCMLAKEKARLGYGTYFNLALMPSLNFKNDFHVTASVVYNSKVYSNILSSTANCYSRIVLGKDFGPFNVHLFGLINFLGKTTDTRFNVLYPDINDGLLGFTYTTYTQLRNSFGAGIRYNF